MLKSLTFEKALKYVFLTFLIVASIALIYTAFTTDYPFVL